MAAAAGSYDFFDHAADVGIRLMAPSLPALFRTGALALMAWIGPPPEGPETLIVTVDVEAPDHDELLVRWLQELVVLFQLKRFYATAVRELEITSSTLRARVEGGVWAAAAFEQFREVKAVTYHKLSLRQEAGVWTARVILDV